MKSDTELMRSAQDGCSEAFEALVMRHDVGIFNFFARMHGNRALAEDQTQEVFLKLYNYRAKWEPAAKFTTFLYRIAKNIWIDWVRKQARRGRQDSLDRTDENDHDWYERLPGDLETPLESAMRSELATEIDKAVQALPEGARMVFVLGAIQEMRYADIASALEIPEGTVKSRMHSAVTQLRARLRHAAL